VWKPVSTLEYKPLNPKAQVLVVVCPVEPGQMAKALERWKERGVALIHDSGTILRDVVRDLLANPQVRAIVFDGPAHGRELYDAFWLGSGDPGWRIDTEHLQLVRQFVDLYDDDCGIKSPMQPFWPARIAYLDEMETK
jgi:hypothetical protein